MKYVGVKHTGELRVLETQNPDTDDVYLVVEPNTLGAVPFKPFEFVHWTGSAWEKVTDVQLATTIDVNKAFDEIEALIPEGASEDNKLATASDVAGVQEDVDTIEGKIPSDTSTDNKLVNESGLQDAIDNASESWSTGFTPKGESSVSDLNDLTTQSNGDSYIVTDSGTLTDGSLAVVAGDQVAWDATNSVWYKLPQYALRSEVDNISDAINKTPASAKVPVYRAFKNLFSEDMVGNFGIEFGNGKLNALNLVPQIKSCAIPVTAGNYTISGYKIFEYWCVGIWSRDFKTRIAVKTPNYTSDADSRITIPSGSSWGSADYINIAIPSDCYIVVALYNWDLLRSESKLQVEAGTTATSYEEGVKLLPNYATLKDLDNLHVGNPLYGKRILVLGDSVTELNTYTNSLETKYGCYIYNRGRGGSSVAERTGRADSFAERILRAESDVKSSPSAGMPSRSNIDAVIVWGGINDWGDSVPMGSVDGTIDKTTFFGALKFVVDWLKQKYYGKPIIVLSVYNAARSTIFTSFNRVTFNNDGSFSYRKNSQQKYLSDYNDAAKSVCKLLGVMFVDMFECGISFVDEYDYIHYSYKQGDPEVPDGLHFNADGGDIVARYIFGKIENVIGGA